MGILLWRRGGGLAAIPGGRPRGRFATAGASAGPSKVAALGGLPLGLFAGAASSAAAGATSGAAHAIISIRTGSPSPHLAAHISPMLARRRYPAPQLLPTPACGSGAWDVVHYFWSFIFKNPENSNAYPAPS